MEIRKVSDSVAIYSDGKRLQVIHNLGDEFILDFKVGEGMQRLKHAIDHFERFEQYIRDNQDDLMVWWHNPGRKTDDQ